MLLAHWLQALRSRSGSTSSGRGSHSAGWSSRSRPAARRRAFRQSYREVECWSVESLEDRTLLSATSFSATDLNASTPEDLAQSLVGPGVQISNVQYTGSNIAAGSFVGGEVAGLGIEDGIILSTGNVASAAGPNTADNTTTVLNQSGDNDLDAILGSEGATSDATVLEFDFVADSDFVTFTYVFASEEYNEFAGSQFNDAFAFFVNGENVALLPGTQTPVTINNVNAQSNSQYFNNNDPGDLGTPTPYGTEYDGFTTPLTATVAVTPGEVNHIKLVIADVADSSYDSAVFIAAESFVSAKTDLSAVMQDDPDPVVIGQPLQYAVSVTNSGPDTATGVVLTDELPDGMQVQSVTIQNVLPEPEGEGTESPTDADFVVEQGVLSVDVGELSSGQEVLVTITVIPTVGGQFTNSVSVSSNELDPNEENNTANQQTTVLDTGSIAGVKFHDLNANGYRSHGEEGLAGFTIEVRDANGDVVATAVTQEDNPETEEIDESGAYIIDGLSPGTYAVSEVQQEGWNQSAPAGLGVAIITIAGGDTQTVDFGNYQYATVEGLKFHDLNANGVQDEGEPGLAGFTIEVRNGNGQVVGTALTREDDPETESIDETGTYTIGGLNPGFYYVTEVQQDGWIQSTPLGEDSEFGISDAHIVFLDSGDTRSYLDFGNYQYATVDGVKFHDLNANGVQDEGELGIAGVTIEIVQDGEVVGTAVTREDNPETEEVDESGTYVIAGLLPGTYTVREVLENGWQQSTPGGGYDVTLASGDSAGELDFGNYQYAAVGGVKFHDLNANGVQDEGELGIAGITIEIVQNGEVVASTTTREDNPETEEVDETGTYVIAGLIPGAYTVREVVDEDWQQSTPEADYDVTLQSGETRSDLDFGNYQYVTVSGFKFHDLNGNGERDEGEPGLAGFTIEIRNSEGEVVGTVETREDDPQTEFINETGTYSIGGLDPGFYYVTEVQQDGWIQSTPLGEDPEYGISDAYVIFLDSGDTRRGLDFGNYQYATVSGLKFHDLNANGVQDEGEPGLAGVMIEIVQNGEVVGSTTTREDNPETEEIDETGTYVITGLVPGTYIVREVVGEDWQQSTPEADYDVTLESGETLGDLDFGNYQFATIEGLKFHDLNANGVQDEGEPGLAGVTIEIVQNGEVVATAETREDNPETEEINEAGTYIITGLVPGTYTVREVVDGDWQQSAPESDYEVTLESGEALSDLDFGNYQFATISGLKFHDLNANGVQDEGELRLAGVTIEIVQNGEVVASTTTREDNPETEEINEAGTYVITGLVPGDYTVREVVDEDWQQSTPETDYDVTLESGETVSDLDFGNYQFVTIEGFKFHDLNANGVQDEGETGLAGFTIEIVDANGQVVGTAETQEDNPETEEFDETGIYVVTGLLPGTYTVREVQQDDWQQSAPEGSYEVTLDSGETVSDLNFGNFQFVSIEGFKFHDLNANGVQDEGEPGLAGFTIEVVQDGEVVATAVTLEDDPETEEVDETGTYVVLGLLPGSYVVREVQQPGYELSFPNGEVETYTVDLTSGQLADGVDFGNYQFYGTDEDTSLVVNAANGVLHGNAGTATLVEGPQNGTLTLNADGSFTYQPTANFNGFDSFTYQADGVVATVILGVLSLNDAPVAAHDSYRADAGGTLVVTAEQGLLANDTDVDGDELFVDIELVGGPSNGTLELNSDGSFTYTPDEGFNSGVDTFTYLATDGELNSQEVTVTINVNDPAFNDFADEVDQIVRDTLVENGLDPDTKELGDEAVNEQINARVLEAYEEFLANYQGDEDFSNVVIVWLDPADFVVTDSEGRSSGFTEGQGQSSEIGDTFYSGNGDVEVMVIANAGSNPYQIEVSGTGSARGGASFITPDGVSTATFQDTLSAGETLVVALDPAEPGLPGGLDVAEGGVAGQDGNPVLVGTDDLALADDAAAAVAALQGTLDAENQSRPDLDVYQQIVMWIDTIDVYLDDLAEAVGDELQDSVLGKLIPLDWLDEGQRTEQQQALLDFFWAGVGRYLLGPGAEVFNLGEFIGNLMPESESESQESPGDAPPEVTGQPNEQPAAELRKEATDAPREARETQSTPTTEQPKVNVEDPVRSTQLHRGEAPRVAPETSKKSLTPIQPA